MQMSLFFDTKVKQTGKPRCKRTADFALTFPKGFVGSLVESITKIIMKLGKIFII